MKAILIINKPTECVDCPCAIESEGSYWCNAECKDVTTEAYEGIPKWCPLKPMPKKMYVEANSIEDVMPSEFDMDKFILEIRLDADKLCALGWNACLDAITGEQNGNI